MATVYNIKIKTTSAFVNYPEKEIEEVFLKFINNYQDDKTKLGFESTEIEVLKDLI